MANWVNPEKGGQSSIYDAAYDTYDSIIDPLSGNSSFYDYDGVATSYTNEPKSS